MKDINIRALKLLEENIGVNHPDLVLSNCFLDTIPKAQVTKKN